MVPVSPVRDLVTFVSSAVRSPAVIGAVAPSGRALSDLLASVAPAEGQPVVVELGPGTGVAPFRAFVQERGETGASGRNWLFFGHQRRACDFFYEDELQAMKESGFLTNLTRAVLWLDRGIVRRLDKGYGEFESWSNDILEREATAGGPCCHGAIGNAAALVSKFRCFGRLFQIAFAGFLGSKVEDLSA